VRAFVVLCNAAGCVGFHEWDTRFSILWLRSKNKLGEEVTINVTRDKAKSVVLA
jgi:hypothetical protein